MLKRCAFLFTALTVFLTLLVPQLYAQEETVEEKPEEPIPIGTISSIQVIGLKRTKPHIARYPLEQFIGKETQDLDLNQVMAAVKDTSVLEPVEIKLAETESGITLQVSVQEKWSFFPVPLVIGGSGESNFGLFLADTNAFGIRDQAVIGAMYGTSGLMAMVMYNHTPSRKGVPGWTTAFMYGRDEREEADRRNTIHRLYTTDSLLFFARVNYPFENKITVSTGVSYAAFFLKDNPDALNQPIKGATLISFSPGISVRYSDWDGYLLSERSTSLTYTYNLVLNGSSFNQVEWRGIYEKSFVPGFRLNAKSGASWKSGTDPFFEDGPHKAQVAILPRKFSARHYAGLSAGLEKYLLKARFGTLSVLGSWQAAFANGPLTNDTFEFNHGPAASLHFYLSRIAIPAVGMGFAYNMSTNIFQFSFSVGMGL